MLSIELLRQQPDLVRQGLARRGEADTVDEMLRLDERWRQLVAQVDELRADRNAASKGIGELIKQKGASAAAGQREEVRAMGERLARMEDDLRDASETLRQQMLTVPNLPAADVPDGADEASNIIVNQKGEPRSYDFTLRPHWELSESLGITDMERAAKLSGSRFIVFKEAGIRLQRALVTWMLDLHRNRHGYHEVGLPFLVRRDVMEGSAQLPKFGDNLYHDDEDDLWLIPTAEVPLTNLHRDEILEPGSLPIKYMAHTPCFRREKVAAGRDVRGIKRVHQFEKVEMYQFVEPERSDQALEELVAHAEEVCLMLAIPHRVLQICAGDLGFQSAKCYDVELWSPASEEWLEVSSCSNCTDFQARRANIRFRRETTGRPAFVHTLNGSGLALPRVIIAILENYQRADGSVEVPAVLQPYLGQDVLKPVGV
jgi:seryl-tRNA synthetase